MKAFSTRLVCATLVGLASARLHEAPETLASLYKFGREKTQENLRESAERAKALTWTSKLDNFNATDRRTFQQRYWINDDYWDENTGPVFLYICGEWTCSAPSIHSYPMMVGMEHNALLVSLEHRYYGDSQPFDDWSTENMKWLTSEQALADTANFIDGINRRIGKRDWIIAGGSYPGAFVAWFKSKYPDHVVGAWSSSGVIHPIMDFTDMDFDTYDRTMASDPVCTSTI